MRRVEQLIDESRRETENQEFTDTTGIATEEFIRYLNGAQDKIQSGVAKSHQRVFLSEKLYDVISYQEFYDLPDDIYLDNRVTNIWYSRSGRDKDFFPLDSGSMSERIQDSNEQPSIYIRTSGQFILSPIPSKAVNGGIKMAYVRKRRKLDIRRAKISSVTTAGNAITSLVFDVTSPIDSDAIVNDGYMCAVARLGDTTMSRIPVDSIDTTTGIVTLTPGFTFLDGETIEAGNYAVMGYLSTNKPELADICEQYLMEHTNWKILKRDSSTDSVGSDNERVEILRDIIEMYKEVDDDVKTISITSTQFIDDEDLWVYS